MTAEQIVVIVLLAAAFAAGWIARDPPRRAASAPGPGDAPPEPPAPDVPSTDAAPIAATPAQEPRAVATSGEAEEGQRLVAAVADALAGVVDAWMEEQEPGPALAALDGAIARLRRYASRRTSAATEDALAAATQARALAEGARRGRPLDAVHSRALEPLEERLERAGGRATKRS